MKLTDSRIQLCIILVLGLALRLFGLDTRSIWVDEMTSLEIGQKSFAAIVGGDQFDRHTPPVYYLLLHLWFSIVPASLFTLRLFSTVVDLLNIVLVAKVFGRQFGRPLGNYLGTYLCPNALCGVLRSRRQNVFPCRATSSLHLLVCFGCARREAQLVADRGPASGGSRRNVYPLLLRAECVCDHCGAHY